MKNILIILALLSGTLPAAATAAAAAKTKFWVIPAPGNASKDLKLSGKIEAQAVKELNRTKSFKGYGRSVVSKALKKQNQKANWKRNKDEWLKLASAGGVQGVVFVDITKNEAKKTADGSKIKQTISASVDIVNAKAGKSLEKFTLSGNASEKKINTGESKIVKALAKDMRKKITAFEASELKKKEKPKDDKAKQDTKKNGQDKTEPLETVSAVSTVMSVNGKNLIIKDGKDAGKLKPGTYVRVRNKSGTSAGLARIGAAGGGTRTAQISRSWGSVKSSDMVTPLKMRPYGLMVSGVAGGPDTKTALSIQYTYDFLNSLHHSGGARAGLLERGEDSDMDSFWGIEYLAHYRLPLQDKFVLRPAAGAGLDMISKIVDDERQWSDPIFSLPLQLNLDWEGGQYWNVSVGLGYRFFGNTDAWGAGVENQKSLGGFYVSLGAEIIKF